MQRSVRNTILAILAISVLIISAICILLFAAPSSKPIQDIDNQPAPSTQTPPSYINETQLVEDYIRNNIATIATEAPVLGGSWYVVSVAVDEATDSAIVVYEDGHIQGTTQVFYTLTGSSVAIIDTQK